MGNPDSERKGKRGNSVKVLIDTEALTCLKETGFTWEDLRLALVVQRRKEMEERGTKGDPGPSEKTFARMMKSGEATEDFGASLLRLVKDIIQSKYREWGYNRNRQVDDLLPFSLADWGPAWEQIKENRRRRIAELNVDRKSDTNGAA